MADNKKKTVHQDAPERLDAKRLTLREKMRLLRFEMSSANLKIYGCITAFFYTLSFTVIQNGLIHVWDYGPGELAEAMARDPNLMMLSTWGTVFQLIGGLSIPVFAFLLVEGFVRTHHLRAYFLRVLVFAIISEVPFDFAMSMRPWDLSGQNVMFTYLFCLVMLYGLRLFRDQKGFRFWVVRILIILATIFWSILINSQFALATILLCAVYYIMYDSKGMRLVVGAAVGLMYITAPLSTYALWKFNGERGKVRNKYIYYVLYPAHLLILGVMARWMSR